MAYNAPNCVAVLGNTGLSNCLDKLEADAMLVWTLLSFQFASEALAEVEANWITGINAGTVYPMPLFDEVEPTLEDNVKQETGLGTNIFVREGKYGGLGRVRTALCNLSDLRTFNEVSGRVFIVTGNGKIYGTSPDGAIFRGFTLSEFHVSYLGSTDGTVARMVTFDYQLKNPTEMGDFPAVPQLTWDPLTQLTGVVDVTVTVDSSVEGLVVLSVARDCDNEVVTPLVEGDFIITASDGTTAMLPSDGFTDNLDGSYDFVFDTPVLPADTYTTNLNTPALQTTGQLEGSTVASFVIS